jgi:hypothetical protein
MVGVLLPLLILYRVNKADQGNSLLSDHFTMPIRTSRAEEFSYGSASIESRLVEIGFCMLGKSRPSSG